VIGEQREFAPVERESVERCPEGEAAVAFEAGDFILTHGDAWTSRLIRFGQGLRIHGDDRKYTHWNHAAIIVSGSGDLIEALGRGVSRTHLDTYRDSEYHLVRITASAEDREQAVAFAEWAAGSPEGDGRQRYGYLTIVSIAYTLATGGMFTFGIDGQAICSGLVARAMERVGAIFNRSPTHIMPADLAKYYQVEPPARG
jgi:uncharacterized protein YycO